MGCGCRLRVTTVRIPGRPGRSSRRRAANAGAHHGPAPSRAARRRRRRPDVFDRKKVERAGCILVIAVPGRDSGAGDRRPRHGRDRRGRAQGLVEQVGDRLRRVQSPGRLHRGLAPQAIEVELDPALAQSAQHRRADQCLRRLLHLAVMAKQLPVDFFEFHLAGGQLLFDAGFCLEQVLVARGHDVSPLDVQEETMIDKLERVNR